MLAACTRAAPESPRSEAAPDNTQRPVVTIAPVADSVVAGDALRFLVSAAPAPSANLTVGVTIASDPCELTEPPDSVTIGAGKSQATLTVKTIGVTVGAKGCVVTAAIATGEGYAAGDAAGATASATLTTQPVVTIAAGASPVSEGSAVSFTLTAAPAPATDLTVNVSWSDPGSFLAASGSGTVTISGSMRTATLTANTDDDETAEQDGSVEVTVDPGSGYMVGMPKSATVDVTDNDQTARSPVPAPPGPAPPAPTPEGPRVPLPNPPVRTPPAPAPPAPPISTVTIASAGSTVHSEFPRGIFVTVDEGGTMSYTLEAMPAPSSTLTVALRWYYTGDYFDPPLDPELKLTPRPETVTIPTSGTASFTLTAGDNDKRNYLFGGSELISVWPGDGYKYGVPSRLYIDVEDDE